MKKFKKFAAVIVATVTLAATAITASAADNWLEVYYNRGAVNSSYYLANNRIHYTNLLNGEHKSIFTFSSVPRNLMEGNIVLSVDFSDPYDEYAWNFENYEIGDYLDDIYLRDSSGKFITEGKYPLTVNFNAPDCYVNIMVDTNWRVFNNFDLTRAYFSSIATNSKTKKDLLQLHYQIKDIYVLPSYNIILEEITTSSNPAKFTSEFCNNNCGTYIKNRKEYDLTTGCVEFDIPMQYRGKSFNVYINSMKVGKVTIPYETANASYTNY